MPLIKDILNNLSKPLTQIEKLNLQIEKTISSSKTSIKNIKDVSSNIKELKVNNDKYNKAFEEFNLNSNELSKKINKYLENPTPEKALKVKYQINVSNDYLAKATTVFSENKTSSDKVINSLNKYKNNNPINDIEKLIKFTSRLKPSFTKLINSVNKLKTKTQIKAKTKANTNTKTRKVYLHNETTPDPTCETKRQKLADDIKYRNYHYGLIILNYLKIITSEQLYKNLEAKYDKEIADQNLELRVLEVISKTNDPLEIAYRDAFKKVQDDNDESVLTTLNLDLAQALQKKPVDLVKVDEIQGSILINTIRINQNFDDFQEAVVNLGTISPQTNKELYQHYLVKLKLLLKEQNKHSWELRDIKAEIVKLQNLINVSRNEVVGYDIAIADGEKYIKEHCP